MFFAVCVILLHFGKARTRNDDRKRIRSESRYRQLLIWLVWEKGIQQVGMLQQG